MNSVVWVSELENSGEKLPFWYMPKFSRGKSSCVLVALPFLLSSPEFKYDLLVQPAGHAKDCAAKIFI